MHSSSLVLGIIVIACGVGLIIALVTGREALLAVTTPSSIAGNVAQVAGVSTQSISAISSLAEQKTTLQETKPKPQLFSIKALNQSAEMTVAVIMYHHILSWVGAEGDAIEHGLRVSPEVFERHLLYIKNEGYTTITTKDLYMFATGQLTSLPPKPILLTFDDGYTDNSTLAAPLLKKYNMKGDFAIITGLVGNAGYMTWDQIQKLVEDGHYISSHTVHHCQLASKNYNKDTRSQTPWLSTPIDETYEGCSAANSAEQLRSGQVRYELRESKKTLENKLNIPIVSIVYPFGGHNDMVIKIAAEEGYQLGFTVVGQSQEKIDFGDPLRIPRYMGFGQDGGNYLQGFFAGYR